MNKSFYNMLNEFHKKYDEKEKMICEDNVFSDYHSKWKGRAHKTVDSLSYAVALLQSGENLDRANDIIERILSLQDLCEDSPTYGLWSWYLEEPLDKMAPPDFNWADFCSTKLLFAVTFGYDKEKVKNAVIAACKCIIKRDVKPDYMNISVLGAFATLFAGEMYGEKNIFGYGKNRLKEFYDSNIFSEYNSTSYVWILIRTLTDITERIKDSECRDIADKLLDRVWGMVAVHFHPETMQWSGPMTRTYSTLIKKGMLGAVMAAVFGRKEDEDIVMGSEDFISMAKCPEKYRHYFEKTVQPRSISMNFISDMVANAYITPKYCIGSFEKCDMWNQRRTVLAFWGTPEDVKCFSVRVLHDGYDYCSATMTARQEKGRVDAQITFETTGGDTHINLDRIKDGKIMAKDLRVVFDFHNTEPKYLTIHQSTFDGQDIESNVTERGIEIILYSGVDTEIDFKSIGKSIIRFTVDMDKKE